MLQSIWKHILLPFRIQTESDTPLKQELCDEITSLHVVKSSGMSAKVIWIDVDEYMIFNNLSIGVDLSQTSSEVVDSRDFMSFASAKYLQLFPTPFGWWFLVQDFISTFYHLFHSRFFQVNLDDLIRSVNFSLEPYKSLEIRFNYGRETLILIKTLM